MSEPRERPLWLWILLALSPSLGYVGFAALSFVWPDVAIASVFLGIFVVPLLTILVLVRLADRFCTAHEDPSACSRALFVAGFALVNGLVWWGGCSITASNMPGTIYDERRKPPTQPDTEPRDVAPAPSP